MRMILISLCVKQRLYSNCNFHSDQCGPHYSVHNTKYILCHMSAEKMKISFVRADGTMFMHVISKALLSGCNFAAGKSTAHKACLHLP